eukprot:TRINITY_DN10612_c0_g2_i1.p1 TRINITY_DN10612_c0_g2~~TRINITY_DN10612_c0_g2_i1.p1  ORF type:complete len:534 (+),score=87.33 TRINITY_DN10612_c0_g2_i1:144-1604(+)
MPTLALSESAAPAVDASVSQVLQFPRNISALDLLEEDSDSDSSICCGFANIDSEDADEEGGEVGCGRASMMECQAGSAQPTQAKPSDMANQNPLQAREQKRPASSRFILPKGKESVPGATKFVCAIHVGMNDLTGDFCLVKRILGKGGDNMKTLASDFNARIRLRGIGSGFLEGERMREAEMPLRLDVSCSRFEDYCGVVDRLVDLLQILHGHYRRYLTVSRAVFPPIEAVSVLELRRDDLGFNKLDQKQPCAEYKPLAEHSRRDPPQKGVTADSEQAPPDRGNLVPKTRRTRRVSDGYPCLPVPASVGASGTLVGPGSAITTGLGCSAKERAEMEQTRRFITSAPGGAANAAGGAEQSQIKEPPRTPPLVSKRSHLIRGHTDSSDALLTPLKLSVVAAAETMAEGSSTLSSPSHGQLQHSPLILPKNSDAKLGLMPPLPCICLPSGVPAGLASDDGLMSDKNRRQEENICGSKPHRTEMQSDRWN